MGCGLTANGVAALAASLSASSPDKAPLVYFRTDQWALRPGTIRLALSAGLAPTPEWRKAGAEGTARINNSSGSANEDVNGSGGGCKHDSSDKKSSSGSGSSGHSRDSAVRLFGLGASDLSLLCAMLGKNNEVRISWAKIGSTWMDYFQLFL